MQSRLDIGKAIGKSIAKHRKNNDLTQANVAENLDMSIDAISRIERGYIMPTVPRLLQFAKLFNCEITDFFKESSPIVSEQADRIIELLEGIEENKRYELIDIFEKIVQWHKTN